MATSPIDWPANGPCRNVGDAVVCVNLGSKLSPLSAAREAELAPSPILAASSTHYDPGGNLVSSSLPVSTSDPT